MRSKPNANQPQSEAPGRAGLSKAVSRCQSVPAALNRLRDIYAKVDAEIDALSGRCLGGGCCCRFDLAGHSLYASTAELALLAMTRPPGPCVIGRCPYQIGPRCSARPARTLGCRTFFCDKNLTLEFQQIHERWHRQIRLLHEGLDLEYFYIDLPTAMADLAAEE